MSWEKTFTLRLDDKSTITTAGMFGRYPNAPHFEATVYNVLPNGGEAMAAAWAGRVKEILFNSAWYRVTDVLKLTDKLSDWQHLWIRCEPMDAPDDVGPISVPQTAREKIAELVGAATAGITAKEIGAQVEFTERCVFTELAALRIAGRITKNGPRYFPSAPGERNSVTS